MNQRTFQIGALAVIVALVGWIGFDKGGPGSAAAETVAPTTIATGGQTVMNTVTVTAEGSIKVEPDVAYVNFAVEARGAKATDAQKANANQFAAIEKTLYGTFGIDKKDVKTTGFNVYPEYNYTEKDGQVLKGYVSVHSVQVTYRKLGDIGKLLDAVSAAGANRVDGVQFSTEKQDQYELEALKNAMATASAKANVLASAGKRTVTGVVNIVQGAASSPPIYYASASESAKADMAGGAPTSVQTGQIEISASVTVQYSMQ